jgi:histone deacetylase HOS3
MPSPSPNGAKSHILRQVEEKPPLRACDVAEEYFRKELEKHESAANAGTIVLVHDQCYGHRFSRPKTTKSHLSLIVERPERILASVMGISAAYVRLGERHCDGNHAPHPQQGPPERIPFKIRKTSRAVDITSPVVTNVHGVKWMQELRDMCADAPRKLASTGKELAREPNPPGEATKTEFHAGDLYLAPESLNAFQGALGGVLDAVDAVFQGTSSGTGPSRAFVCIRPPGHHCSDDHPSGFCWINNVHVGIEHAIMQYGLTHAAIIDFDLHHGDGSQAITWSRNKKVQNLSKNTSNKKKTSIGYFSLHDINSYPCEDGEDDKVQAASLCIENAHGQTIWNVHLQPWSTPEEFWQIYEERYLILLEKVRTYLKLHTRRLQTSPNHPAPKAAIFLSAGFDASEWELQGMQRHGVSVPTEFYARFTKDVVSLAEEEGTGVEGRVISVLEGGYSDRALTSGVLSHISGLTTSQVLTEPPTSDGSVFDMSKVLSALSLKPGDSQDESPAKQPSAKPYDPHWWHVSQLTELEDLVHPPPPKPKKPRTGPLPTYCSPTQSFTAKLADPTTYRRSVSGNLAPTELPRGPTPPPPDVEWATATHALSKLLIPSDRQTTSCKHGELAEVKVKKEKPPPVLNSVHVDPSGRQLRGRKAVATYADPESDHESVRAESRVNRRRTMAALPTPTEETVPSRPASRRMSIASTTGSVNGDRSNSRASSVVPGRRQSVAPAASVASVAGSEVAVKKSRSSTATASRIPKNRPPVPRVPSGYSSKQAVPPEKENEMDQLTTGLKRIKLKLPPKEEYEARERQKASDAAKKAPTTTGTKTTTRRPAVARSKSSKETTTTKKSVGRPPKVPKPANAVEVPGLPLAEQQPFMPKPPTPEAPKIEAAATSPALEQPQPVPPEQSVAITPKVDEGERSTPTEVMEPPTELREMAISPNQFPKPAFMKTAVEPLATAPSPPRPDTPPPPAPSMMPSFVNYTAQTFGSGPSRAHTTQASVGEENQTLEWVHTSMEEQNTASAIKRQELPVFSANGVIPFALNPNAASSTSTGNPTESKGKADDDKNINNDIWEVPDTPAR